MISRLVATTCGAALLAGVTATAHAQEQDKRFYVAPMAMFTAVDDNRQLDDAIGGVLSVGKPLTSGLNFELTGWLSEADYEDTTMQEPAELKGFGASFLLFPNRDELPFFGILGVSHGTTELHPAAGGPANYESTVGDIGIGAIYPIFSDRVYVRGQAMYRYDSHNRRDAGDTGKDGFYEAVAALGLHVTIGKSPATLAAEKEAEEAALVPVVQDSDNDGVNDDADACPGTARGVKVDSRGCERDSDGDGVLDGADQCPNTPAGQPVDAKGCSLDGDHDGVLNKLDQCPNTPAGAEVLADGCALTNDCRIPQPGDQVDADGCAVTQAVILRGVNFDLDSARLTPNAKAILDTVGDALLSIESVNVEIGGHTDSLGSNAYNQKLSQRRAESVKTYLSERGVAADRMEVKGYGEAEPVAPNDTAEGRELNRRVELKILE
ncbi:MAG: OmpA family protein [Abyssibacter sp.]|uniref:OmpA family protein n=1 Tax=Abyssibacter sp. TaxID=2320200 RepID=UPI00321BAE24